MVFGSVISSPRGRLSLQQAIDLTKVYLENASNSTDPDIRLVLCHDVELSLKQAKKIAKRTENKAMHQEIAKIYTGLGDLLIRCGHENEAQTFRKKSKEWG